MDILMMLLWLVIGALITGSLYFIYTKLQLNNKMSILAWVLVIITIVTALFAIAWSIASIQENEMQAAGLGMLVFGGFAVILGFVTKFVVGKNTKKLAE